MTPKPRNQSWQAMGAKGRSTRLRLMEAVGVLLQTTSLPSLRVSEVAAAAGTSPATFYLYFGDVADAALALIDSFTQSTDMLLQMVLEKWPKSEALDRAHHFVETYASTWESHAALLNVRNLAAEAGDVRFRQSRERAVKPLQDAIASRLAEGQRDGRIPSGLHPLAVAGAIIALLERIAAISRTQSQEAGLTHHNLIQATAYILAGAFPTED